MCKQSFPLPCWILYCNRSNCLIAFLSPHRLVPEKFIFEKICPRETWLWSTKTAAFRRYPRQYISKWCWKLNHTTQEAQHTMCSHQVGYTGGHWLQFTRNSAFHRYPWHHNSKWVPSWSMNNKRISILKSCSCNESSLASCYAVYLVSHFVIVHRSFEVTLLLCRLWLTSVGMLGVFHVMHIVVYYSK